MDSEKEKSIRNASWISLGETEEVEAWSHPTIYPFIPMYVIGGAISIIGFFVPFILELPGLFEWAGLLLIPIGIFLVGVEYIRYVTEFYVFTDTRIIKKEGILSHTVKKVAYESIDNLNKEYPLQGRILGYGNLTVVTASPSREDIRMNYLPKMKEATSIIGDYRSEVADKRTSDS